jgi:ribosomal subunit interface protein
MTNLPIYISTHHLTLSAALRRFAQKKIEPVIRFATDALAAEVVLRRHNGTVPRFSASARLVLPGKDIHGRAIHSDLYVAIGQLFEKLARRSRKRKTRLRTAPTRRARVMASRRPPQTSLQSFGSPASPNGDLHSLTNQPTI